MVNLGFKRVSFIRSLHKLFVSFALIYKGHRGTAGCSVSAVDWLYRKLLNIEVESILWGSTGVLRSISTSVRLKLRLSLIRNRLGLAA